MTYYLNVVGAPTSRKGERTFERLVPQGVDLCKRGKYRCTITNEPEMWNPRERWGVEFGRGEGDTFDIKIFNLAGLPAADAPAWVRSTVGAIVRLTTPTGENPAHDHQDP